MSLDQTCLLLIDIQTGLFPTLDPSAAARVEYNIPRLLSAFRQAQHHVSSHTALTPTFPATNESNRSTSCVTPTIETPALSDSVPSACTPGPLIVHVQHHSTLAASVLSSGSPGVRFHSCAPPLPHEIRITKHTNSAFIDTDLSSLLQQHKIERLVVVGLVTEHCVSTTVRMAANLGVVKRIDEADDRMIERILVVRDATAAQAKTDWKFDAALVHEVSLATLHGEFCTVVTTDGVLSKMQTWS